MIKNLLEWNSLQPYFVMTGNEATLSKYDIAHNSSDRHIVKRVNFWSYLVF